MLLAAVNRWKASQGVAQVSAAQLKDWICQRNAGHGCIPTNEQFEQLTVTGRQSVAKAGCSSGCGEAHEVR